MKKCPTCSSKLIKIDSAKPYSKKLIHISFMIQIIVIYAWSGFFYGLTPEPYKNIALILYFIITHIYLYKAYLIEKEAAIYECKKCKGLFKGIRLEPFNYSEWSKKEYNKSLQSDP